MMLVERLTGMRSWQSSAAGNAAEARSIANTNSNVRREVEEPLEEAGDREPTNCNPIIGPDRVILYTFGVAYQADLILSYYLAPRPTIFKNFIAKSFMMLSMSVFIVLIAGSGR